MTPLGCLGRKTSTQQHHSFQIWVVILISSPQLTLYDQPQDIFTDGTINAFTHLNLDNDTSAKIFYPALISTLSPLHLTILLAWFQGCRRTLMLTALLLQWCLINQLQLLFNQNNTPLTTAPLDLVNDASLLSSSQLTSLLSADSQPPLIQPPLIAHKDRANKTRYTSKSFLKSHSTTILTRSTTTGP